MLPLFIELSDGSLVNANHVMRVERVAPDKCYIETCVVADNQYYNGQWSAGGSGAATGYTNNNRVSYISDYSVQEWATRVNNAIALAQAVERMVK